MEQTKTFPEIGDNFHIVCDGTLFSSGSTPKDALANAQQFGVNANLTLDDIVDNTSGRWHQVTSRDVVLRDNLDDVYIP
mgnify:CR=1 FL=1|tara:strand:+ start:42 stop:278 length:237 start_codon:yes stop_codon:yes gene_type:complete